MVDVDANNANIILRDTPKIECHKITLSRKQQYLRTHQDLFTRPLSISRVNSFNLITVWVYKKEVQGNIFFDCV